MGRGRVRVGVGVRIRVQVRVGDFGAAGGIGVFVVVVGGRASVSAEDSVRAQQAAAHRGRQARVGARDDGVDFTRRGSVYRNEVPELRGVAEGGLQKG